MHSGDVHVKNQNLLLIKVDVAMTVFQERVFSEYDMGCKPINAFSVTESALEGSEELGASPIGIHSFSHSFADQYLACLIVPPSTRFVSMVLGDIHVQISLLI